MKASHAAHSSDLSNSIDSVVVVGWILFLIRPMSCSPPITEKKTI